MFCQRGARILRRQWPALARHRHRARRDDGAIFYKMMMINSRPPSTISPIASSSRSFHTSLPLQIVKPVLLADIGEGIVECEIIQWFVQPEARVEEFSPLCEVQSDKASVEITSRFAGVVKKLHYDAGEMAKVGRPFVDIDIQGDAKKKDLDALTAPAANATADPKTGKTSDGGEKKADGSAVGGSGDQQEQGKIDRSDNTRSKQPNGPYASLATPAVRHLLKELNIEITDVEGTGKGGRVMKEDVHRFFEQRKTKTSKPAPGMPHQQGMEAEAALADTATQVEKVVPLTNIQNQMFKTMTRSLAIPHFLYTDEVDFSRLYQIRRHMNHVLASGSSTTAGQDTPVTKLSYLPFIVKAVSLALNQYPILNARVELGSGQNQDVQKPALVQRSLHNIGIAMDTPSGLLVPVVRNVAARSLVSIAAELKRLQGLAAAGRLALQDLAAGTITVSNIGNIGGGCVGPVIVDREVAILGVGRVREVPGFASTPDGGDYYHNASGGGGGSDENPRDSRSIGTGNRHADRIVRRQMANFSWSADHRVIDGATMARAAEVVRQFIERPDLMLMYLR